MKARTRNILIVVGVFVVLVISLVGYGMYRVYSFLSSVGLNREVPEAIKEARVTKGADLLTRTEFFKVEKGGFMKAIGDGSKIQDEKERERVTRSKISRSIYNFADLAVIGNEVIAVAQFGGFVFDLQGNLKKEITFEASTERVKIGPIEAESQQSSLDNLRIVRLDTDRIGFVSHGPLGGARVFDENGNIFWSMGKETIDVGKMFKDGQAEYEKSTYVLEATVGDIDGDGVSEYMVARKNVGVIAYDRAGAEKWSYADDFPMFKLMVVDMDGDGRNELLEIGRSLREGSTGKVIREIKGKGDAVVLVPTKDSKLQVNFANIYDGQIFYLSEDGSELFKVDAPLSKIAKPAEQVEVSGYSEDAFLENNELVSSPKAVLVNLQKNKPAYLAVVAAFIGIPRANLYVYDQAGTLVYHELLPEEAETIAALPAGDVDNILIGGKETIWRYAPR